MIFSELQYIIAKKTISGYFISKFLKTSDKKSILKSVRDMKLIYKHIGKDKNDKRFIIANNTKNNIEKYHF